jgi:hypothetical protein
VVDKHGGHVAQYLDDGVLAYFGYDGEPLVARVTVNGVRMEPPDPFFASLSARASVVRFGTRLLHGRDLVTRPRRSRGRQSGHVHRSTVLIELNAGSSNPTVATASLRARLQKK